MNLPMAPAARAFTKPTLIAAVVMAASLLGFAQSTSASAPSWLRNAIRRTERGGDRQHAPPLVARYAIDEGGVFTLDRSSPEPLLKFEDSPEIWVLRASNGPRGDLIYRNDMGEPVLRATKLGGMTVFTSRRPGGSAAALVGPSSPLRLAPLGPVALYQRLIQSSVRCSRAAQHLVGFDAEANPVSDGLIADAALVAVSAVTGVAVRSRGKALLAKVGKVAFVEGRQPDVQLRGGVLMITVAPPEGVAGRPSSERIMRVLGVY